MLKAVLFDLDGTILPFDEDEFTKLYFKLLCKKCAPLGYTPDKLIECIWAGVKEMVQNDGKKTNFDIFWDRFENYFGKEKKKDEPYITSFYTNEFKQTSVLCKENPYILDILKYCKENELKVILATQPIFPKDGTLTRMSFVGLKEEDFDYISTYENSYYSKPNPAYYTTILDAFNLQPEEVIHFGNNELEDGIAKAKCGIETYMVGDYIMENDKLHGVCTKIDWEEVLPTIQKHQKSE